MGVVLFLMGYANSLKRGEAGFWIFLNICNFYFSAIQFAAALHMSPLSMSSCLIIQPNQLLKRSLAGSHQKL